ncbi:hypothetical protein [Psychromonas sp. GE-S-Ul-11]|jgi:hypothetical protein|uniref:hypothetical protein n=1 Tax=unclassified Psychromonas TaxID=2614957 RepID=UPI00390C8071
MKNIKSLYLVLCLAPLLFINNSIADEVAPCPTVKLNQVHYYQVFSIDKKSSLTDLYNKQIKLLNAFASNNKLERFKVLNQDMSISATSYIPNLLEVNFSISFESKFDQSLLDKINAEFSPQNFSFSVINIEECDA